MYFYFKIYPWSIFFLFVYDVRLLITLYSWSFEFKEFLIFIKLSTFVIKISLPILFYLCFDKIIHFLIMWMCVVITSLKNKIAWLTLKLCVTMYSIYTFWEITNFHYQISVIKSLLYFIIFWITFCNCNPQLTLANVI